MQSKLKESHMLADLHNAQKTEISDIHEHCIPLNVITFVMSGLNYFHNPSIKIA